MCFNVNLAFAICFLLILSVLCSFVLLASYWIKPVISLVFCFLLLFYASSCFNVNILFFEVFIYTFIYQYRYIISNITQWAIVHYWNYLF